MCAVRKPRSTKVGSEGKRYCPYQLRIQDQLYVSKTPMAEEQGVSFKARHVNAGIGDRHTSDKLERLRHELLVVVGGFRHFGCCSGALSNWPFCSFRWCRVLNGGGMVALISTVLISTPSSACLMFERRGAHAGEVGLCDWPA